MECLLAYSADYQKLTLRQFQLCNARFVWFICLIYLSQCFLGSSLLTLARSISFSMYLFQYRMCSAIMELSNALIYGNRLRCGSPEIANAKLQFSSTETISVWLKEVILVFLTILLFKSRKLWRSRSDGNYLNLF